MATTSIITERLVLRRPERADAEALPAILDEVVVAAMGWPPGVVDRYVRSLGRRRSSRGHLVVVGRDHGRPIGVISLGPPTAAWTIGLMFSAEGRGRGLGRESLAAALPWVRRSGAPKAVLETAVTNVAMRRTAEAVGFHAVGTKAGRRLPDGSRVDAVCYVREW